MRHTNLPPITWRSLRAATLALSLLLGILVSDTAQAQVNEPAAPTALARYTRDITAAAEQGKFDSFSDQAKERLSLNTRPFMARACCSPMAC